VATVSNYLNATKPVSREASASIAQAVEQLHYTPNLSARSLKSRVYTKVGVILPNLNGDTIDELYSMLLEMLDYEYVYYNEGRPLRERAYDIKMKLLGYSELYKFPLAQTQAELGGICIAARFFTEEYIHSPYALAYEDFTAFLGY
jgi:hypothetical protein